MSYQPIEDYGIIGDMHTLALVGVNGSIDWLCVPHFDSPSVFAAILDDTRGGYFQISSQDTGVTAKQFYWPETNVLVTRFLSEHGAAELVDFMPCRDRESEEPHVCRIIRRMTAMRGRLRFRMACQPAFDFARQHHHTRVDGTGAVFDAPEISLGLGSNVELARDAGGVSADFALEEGESAIFILRQVAAGAECSACLSEAEAEEAFRRTVDFWRSWVAQCTYTGRWRETVHRSALALKLLTFEPTGAIVAAPTTSLPEGIGGERNWDYRYTWIRDSAFTIYAFLRLGFTEEAQHFMEYLEGLCRRSTMGGGLQIMYGIRGETHLHEQDVHHLDGYRGSRPVRIGNDAYDQLQLDIYGELLDAAYLYNKYGAFIPYDTWVTLRHFVDWVCDHWHLADEGIWEVRSGRQHFVYSKLMCWVAIDRGLRIAERRSLPADLERWRRVRDEIHEEIMTRGWSDERQAFVQHYGSESLDAANLMMVLTLFSSPVDPRFLKTLDAILQPPQRGGLTANSLVHRYNPEESPDGLTGEEGTFNICTFWLVEALTRAGRYDRQRLDEARLIFERMLGFANHLGLYAEETGHSGEFLGNFPQAFTHLALISAAVNLDRALGEGA